MLKGSVFHATGGCEKDVKARNSIAWLKWRELSGVLCDQRMPIAVRGKVYKTTVRSVMIYEWTMRRSEEGLFEKKLK